MVGTLSITGTVAQDMLAAIATAMGAGAQMIVYNGTPPANAAAALSSNTALATLSLASTPVSGYSFNATGGPNANGAEVATLAAIAAVTVTNTGTAAFWRIVNGATALIQGGCSATSGDMVLSTLAFTAGSTLTVSSGSLTQPTGP